MFAGPDTFPKSAEVLKVENLPIGPRAYFFQFERVLTEKSFGDIIVKSHAELLTMYPTLTISPELHALIRSHYTYARCIRTCELHGESTDRCGEPVELPELHRETIINNVFGSSDRFNRVRELFQEIGRENLFLYTREQLPTLFFLRYIGFCNDDNTGIVDNGKVTDRVYSIAHTKKNSFYVLNNQPIIENILRDEEPQVIGETENTITYRLTLSRIFTYYRTLATTGGLLPLAKLNLASLQIGGNSQQGGNKNYYKSYIKYKTKYLKLRSLQL